ncbi:MAG: BlaI family penicillinase repressor [Planctomycetota bacterium]|jgi:BlaI family penicillinase repressor
MSASKHTLGELQLAIMRVLWQSGSASVAEVHQGLPEVRSRALTTIATMLSKMEKKGVVRHRSEGRQFIYEPTVSEDEVKRSMVAELAHRLFDGDFTALVTHLIDEREIDAKELEDLKEKIQLRSKEAK